MSNKDIESEENTSALGATEQEDVVTVDRECITISKPSEEWLANSTVNIGHAVEYVRVSEQQTDAEVALWRYLLSDRTNIYREIVRALIDAKDEFRNGERAEPMLTYNELKARLDCAISRPELSKRVSSLEEGNVVQRGGMPSTISFENKDVALLARIILSKVAPRV